MIDGVTSDDDKVAPVYKLEEVCDLFRSSHVSIVKEVSDYILKHLDHKSPVVKQKLKYELGRRRPWRSPHYLFLSHIKKPHRRSSPPLEVAAAVEPCSFAAIVDPAVCRRVPLKNPPLLLKSDLSVAVDFLSKLDLAAVDEGHLFWRQSHS